jgi:two-component system sensor histidine kinase MtrB
MEDTKLHNGWLQAWGNKGSGSNFRLTVPLRQGEEIDRSPVQLEPGDIVLPGGQNDKNILVLGPGPGSGLETGPGPEAGPASGTDESVTEAGSTGGGTAPGAAATSTKDHS